MSETNGAEPILYRFADPTATATLEVPGCHCPAQSHKSETITYRTELGAGEWESFSSAGLMAGEGEYIDYGVSNSAAIAKSIESWTLLTNQPCFHPGKPHGKHEPLGISRRNVALLDETIRQAILERVKKAAAIFSGTNEEEPGAPPNGSGARSPKSSRASASPIPTIQPPA